MRSLSIDHGTNRCGWSIFEDGKYNESGTWDYSKVMHPQVLQSFYTDVENAFSQSGCGLLVYEIQVDVINAHSTAVLHHMNAVEILFSLQNDIPFHGYPSPEWKKLIGYKGNTEKLEVAYAVAERFGLDVDRIAVPIRYTRDTVKAKKGDVREYLCDESDAIGINWAYWRSVYGKNY